MREKFLLPLLLSLLLLSACYHRPVRQQASQAVLTEQQLDSIAFARTHHYTINYNFLVSDDSLMLTRQMPEEAVSNLPTDSFAIGPDQRLVVADIRILPADSVDSVWVQLAQEDGTFGWVHESEMLKTVEPDDPISQFISFFSDEHLLIFLLVFVLIITAYGMYKLLRRKAHIVHFNDIATFYPTLFALAVAFSATLYASIQLFAPDAWQEFYFHPSLNPFSQPALLALFLSSVWAILIVGIAVVDDTFRHLNLSDGVLYLLGLAGVCAVNYIVFTLTTMYYIGYLLLVAYVAFALWRYFTHTRSKYICGNCGLQIKKKGRCPHCGSLNV
jgi:hypothetical protein